jgi:MHS family alpha-ketoglutarate permease-like MFS transporter
VGIGQLGALAVLLLLQHAVLPAGAMEAWGWRIPFVLGAALALFAIHLRGGIEETVSFRAARKGRGHGGVAVTLRYWRAILYSVGITVGGTVAFYTFTVYTQKFMVNTAGLSREGASVVAAAALLFYLPLQPLLGALSDKVGRRPVLLLFAVSMALLSVPLLTIMAQATTMLQAFLYNVAGLVMLSGFTSVHMLVKAELFPAEVRALGVGLPYALTTAVLGGTTEFVALALKRAGHEEWFYYYVAASAVVTLVTVVLMPETRSVQLSGETVRSNADRSNVGMRKSSTPWAL